MPYITEAFPYPRSPREMTPGAIKKAFAAVMEQAPLRIENISRYLHANHDAMITPSSTDEVVDQLSWLVAGSGAFRPLTPEEIEERREKMSPEPIKCTAYALSQEVKMDEETVAMFIDAGLLWGEIFKVRYPGTYWLIGAKPKLMVDYGEPVLAGIALDSWQFGPLREMNMHVHAILSGSPMKFTLTRIMEMRASELGVRHGLS